jgi:hypothetical protein
VLADGLFDNRSPDGAAFEVQEIGEVMRNPAFGLVVARDGLLLFQRNPPGERVLMQRVEVVDASGGSTPGTTFGPAIGLLQTHITPLGARRFRATFDWLATKSRLYQTLATSP